MTSPSFLASIWHDCGDPLWSSASRSVSVSPPNSIPSSPASSRLLSVSSRPSPPTQPLPTDATSPSLPPFPTKFIVDDDITPLDEVSLGIVRFRALYERHVAIAINQALRDLLGLDAAAFVALLNDAVRYKDSPLTRRFVSNRDRELLLSIEQSMMRGKESESSALLHLRKSPHADSSYFPAVVNTTIERDHENRFTRGYVSITTLPEPVDTSPKKAFSEYEGMDSNSAAKSV